jgi:hypothetical protein
MILRRVMEHVKAQNWFAVGLDFLIVVFGVYTGVLVNDLQNQNAKNTRTDQVIETLRKDLTSFALYGEQMKARVADGLSAWAKAHAQGAKPPPFYFLFGGSYTPPQKAWDALMQMRMTEVLHPALVHDLSFFYSETRGVGEKYVRYAIFVESQIVPYANDGAAVFYDADGETLRPEYQANMASLKLLTTEQNINAAWARCLSEKLKSPREVGEPCTPEFAHRDNRADIEKLLEAP